MKFNANGRFSSANKRTKSVVKKINPFEVHINRTKHQVLGRKLKSDHGMPGVSRSKALQKRKRTLLQEYKMKGKNNHFIDQRIGENNSAMTEDDRIMARFTAERMRRFNKKAMFNLSDTEVLTHRGQTLSEIERFEDTRSDDEDDEPGKSGALKGKFVGNAHFGGGMLTKNKQDRESLIDQLILESKVRKAERQRNKEETLEATEQLDEDWKTLGTLVTSNKDSADKEPVNTQNKDDYDVVMRQLKFEPHGLASQRLKTDEDIAKEDKEHLETLEKERLKQLREIEANKYKYYKSADDLDDGMSYNNNFGDELQNENNEQDNSESSAESDEEAEEENVSSASDEETELSSKRLKVGNEKEQITLDESDSGSESDNYTNEEDSTSAENNNNDEPAADSALETSMDEEELNAMDDLSDLMPSFDEEIHSSKPLEETIVSNTSPEISSENDKINEDELKIPIQLDLPYIINVPECYEAFKSLIKGLSIDHISTIFERLMKSNHPSLAHGNKKKMLDLSQYTLQLVREGEVEWDTLPVLVVHFRSLKEFNREECLKILVDNLEQTVLKYSSKLIRGSPSIPSVKLLTWYCLLLLKPQGMEVLLPVIKPALCFACQLMSHAKPHIPQSVSFAFLSCYLLVQDAKRSSSVYTDAITFLHRCVRESVSGNNNSHSSVASNTSSCPQLKSNGNKSLIDTKADDWKFRLSIPKEQKRTDVDHSQVLFNSIILLSALVKVYRQYPHAKSLFRSVHNTVSSMKADAYPQRLKQEITELQNLLQVLQSARLPPIVKVAKKPKALRQYEPSFHTVTVSKSHRNLPADKQEEQRLIHKYKHEMKGAMRELRRDRVFLANIKLKEQADSDERRIKKVKEIFGSAAAQQGELRSLQRKK